MGDPERLEASGQALAQAGLQEQRGRSQDNHAEGAFPGAVGIPQALDGFGPTGNLLNFVQHQYEPRLGALRLGPGYLPVPDQPLGISHLRRQYCIPADQIGLKDEGIRIGLIHCQVKALLRYPPERLAHYGGLPGLPGAENRDDAARCLVQAMGKGRDLGTLEGRHEPIVYY